MSDGRQSEQESRSEPPLGDDEPPGSEAALRALGGRLLAWKHALLHEEAGERACEEAYTQNGRYILVGICHFYAPLLQAIVARWLWLRLRAAFWFEARFWEKQQGGGGWYCHWFPRSSHPGWRFETKEGARAACEYHYVTGTWERKRQGCDERGSGGG